MKRKALTKNLIYAAFTCTDNSHCNGHGSCDDDGQCDCDRDWSSQPDCSGNLSSLSLEYIALGE